MKTFKWIAVAMVLALVAVSLPLHAAAAAGSVVMASTLGATVRTLADWGKMLDPDGRVAKVAELLSQKNEIVNDIMFKEGNLVTGERLTMRTGLPSVYWRLYNQGVTKSKGTTAQIDEGVGMLEGRSEVDCKLAELGGDVAGARFTEAQAFLEAMAQEIAQTLFYGNAGTAPEEFNGLAIRYASRSASVANSANIVHAGGSGSDNTSIWLVAWGESTCYGIFPKGSKAGIIHQDLGEGDAFDSANRRFRAYMDRYEFNGGLALKDWRGVVRIANVDVSDLVADAAGSSVKLIEYMAKAIDRLPNGTSTGKCVFYANRTVASMLRLQALNKSISNLGVEKAINQFGQEIQQLTFLGIPIRLCDQILSTEATVS
jgi:hypothetical protein